MSGIPLFALGSMRDSSASLSGLLGRKGSAVAEHLRDWDPDDLLNTPAQDVIDQLVAIGTVNCPRLLADEEHIHLLEPTEITQEYIEFDRRMTRRVMRFTLVVPYVDGQREIFLLRASQDTYNPLVALLLNDHELYLNIDNPRGDPEAIKAMFDAMIAEIEEHLSWSRRDIDTHNRWIRDEVPPAVEKRREELLAARNLQSQIGYRIKRRPDADTYTVPVQRKSVRPQQQPRRPSGAKAPFTPEPVMAEQDYREALRVLRDQAIALERTPSLAAKLKEEEIRDVLLIGLNGQFEGKAGGELFNGGGKTDILIRVDNRNIFIGECKVWHGEKSMDEAHEQLFSYLVWRDTKAAILLFIRNKDVTAVIRKAVAKIWKHPNFKRDRLSNREGEYEFTMHASDDPEREIHLTFIPFALRSTTG